jgi:hypothetical protein
MSIPLQLSLNIKTNDHDHDDDDDPELALPNNTTAVAIPTLWGIPLKHLSSVFRDTLTIAAIY